MAGGPGAYPVAFATRMRMNHEVVTWFAGILSGLMGIFIIFHLSRLVAQKTGLASKLSGPAKPFVFVSRIVRRFSVLKFPGLPSVGHAFVATTYIIVNIVLQLTYLDTSVLPYITVIAARAGWLAIANIVFVIFLSLKNTPLGYLTAWSYERLNVLHQVAGYVTMALIIVHGATYSSYFIQANNAARLLVHEEIYGIAAGFTFLTLVLAGAIVRFWYYELFYILHVSFFIISMVLAGLHQPEMTKKMLIATALGSALWMFDRLIRVLRVVYYSFNNTATLYPLPHGGTRVVLKKPPLLASSGEHCFLWIPKIRALEMHPFTIANMDPLEFVINSYDGFTRDLHEYATRNPGTTVKASVEGSYGTFPNPADYDKIVLVAGGSGASFTFGMALNLLKRITQGSKQSIVFVWMVKDPARLEWFSNSLATIRHTLNSSVQLYVTRNPGSQTSSQENVTNVTERSRSGTVSSEASGPFTVSSEKHDEKHAPRLPSKVLTRTISDPEKSGNESELTTPTSPVQQVELGPSIHGIPINFGRPDVSKIITKAIEETPADQRVLVMGCGPETLMTQVRNTAAMHIRPSGPAVELHCEQFGW
ncbi:ferric reductase transmembrane component 5 [Colletotrichum karsti]|uniref:Ferric reductase transmembrane component 5 n=1 Tax=Colletotrichum karsti TaxID=1095194 RepID=A0A9P6IIV9_9PEZI|nr:ferric reductase transmembrane component 5 [Colletotrichum karsti]KAF9882381.1 ferric reductase transmembrane component 5 [Colletotrichum karsti]